MKKKITCFRMLTVAGALFGLLSAEKACATHAQGSDLTYVNVAPNMYVVNYKLYRDCTGIQTAGTETLTYRAPGCDATARTVSMPRIGTPLVGNPYCAGTVAPCTGTSSTLANFEESTYTATVTLPSLCENWILSCRIGNRPSSRNLFNGLGSFLFSEALINNVATQTNNSPSFGNIPIPFVGVDKVINYSHNVVDIDGDSLIYTLVPALNDLNQPVVYGNSTAPSGSGGQIGTNPYPAGVSPAGTPYPAGTFSATNPIISRNPLQIDRLTGSMQFEPLDYNGTSVLAEQGRDKYTVAVQVDEYRNINGVPVKIGHVRRDILIIIIDCGPNLLPRIGSFSINGNAYQHNAVLPVAAGQPLTITVNGEDDNPTDLITLTSNVADVLPGASFTISGGARPTGTISWTPTAADVRSVPYYFTVTATDNACPIKGFQTFTLGLRVNNTGGVNSISKTLPTGSFMAYPNPSEGSEVTFKIKAQKPGKNAEVVIYNIAGKVIDRIPVTAEAGEKQVQWTKKPDMPAGVYFARYTTTEGSQTIKLVHLK